jgi:hypothetical protein
MILTDKFIFIHLQKCAGTFVREYIQDNFPDWERTKREHNGVKDIQSLRNRIVFGTIRNPWEWYVSMYIARLSVQGPFAALYGSTFKQFLENSLFKNQKRHVHDLNFSIIRKLDIGTYSFRYIMCYAKRPDLVFKKYNKVDLISNHDNWIGVDYLCRVEYLNQEIVRLFSKYDIDLTDNQVAGLNRFEKKNTSNHGNYHEYYDEESSNWVAQKDKLIIEKYRYTF